MHRRTMVNRRFSWEAYGRTQFAYTCGILKSLLCWPAFIAAGKELFLGVITWGAWQDLVPRSCSWACVDCRLESVRPSAWIPNHTKLSCDRSWGTFSDD